MPSRPLIVFADDLTGAAEVAGIAHEFGLHAAVVTSRPEGPIAVDVVVFDTNTRLMRPSAAASRLRACGGRIRRWPRAGFFKKTDSVLRGPVLAELSACLGTLGFRRALLVAGNPSLGRVIRGGRCFIGGRPIDRTDFARDPHHPARGASVLELLYPGRASPTAGLAPGDPLPATGIIVGDHRSPRDSVHWARIVDRRTLPAGGADFFRAWLSGQVRAEARPGPSGGVSIADGPALLLHGTTAAPAGAGAIRFNGLRPPSPARVAAMLRHRGAASIAATSLTLRDPLAPTAIARGFAKVARSLRDAGAYRHLLIAGGATAAAVLRALDWTRFDVIRAWGPGVVSLRPAGTDFTVTVKPGSYPWPAGLRRAAPRVFS